MWIPRLIEPVLRHYMWTRPVVVLTGARQTGKTALVRRLFPEYAYVSLDLPSEAEQAEREPARFLQRHPPPLVVDEVQYAPKLLRHLKRAVDARRATPGQFLLTGSQPFEVMAGVTESLAGRAGVLQLSVLSYAEVLRALPDTPVEDVLVRGGFPELYEKPELDARGFYQSYVATYLERDLRAQLRVGSLRDFERFLRAAALRTAGLLNRAELARDVGISPSTAGQWLSVLDRSGVVTLLEPWFSNRTKSLVKTAKLHFRDTGLCAFLMGIVSRSDLMDSPLAGALWESMACGELQRLIQSGAAPWQLAFWRDRTKEADFLLHRAGHIRLADAKWSEHPEGPGKLALVRRELDPPPACAIVCRAANRYPICAGIEALPLAELPALLEDPFP
ncbi:MAG: ATP-binding protein [Thermoguttaceae bacterium]|jgi:predicted AAA+ superfamily ATPase